MKPFNLKEYLENPSRKVVTRDGKPARIICIDAKREHFEEGPHPVIALVEEKKNQETIYCYREDGIFREGYKYGHDLFFAPVKKEGWINLYINVCGTVSTDTTVFPTKEFAQASRKYQHYIDTIHIEWDE